MSRPGWDPFRQVTTETGAINPDFFRFLLGVQHTADTAQPAGDYQPAMTPQPMPAVLPTDGTATVDDLALAINTLRAALIALGLGS